MSWTGFVLEMNDGKLFQFGTSFLVEFFDLPENYSFADVSKIHNHSFVSSKGELGSLKEGFMEAPEDYNIKNTYREKPYFVCYTDGL